MSAGIAETAALFAEHPEFHEYFTRFNEVARDFFKSIQENALKKKKQQEAVERAKRLAALKKTFYATFCYQAWSIPNSVIYYMTKNPTSSKAYEKMIQSCKYFFIKNPILVVPDLTYHFQGKWCFEGDREEIRDVICDIKKCTSKIWIVDNYSVYNYHSDDYVPSETSSIIPRIYRCEAKNIYIVDQEISYSEYLFLTKHVSSLSIDKITIKDGNTVVPLEKLVDTLPELFDLNFADSLIAPCFTNKTIENLFKVPNFLNCRFCYFWDFTESFDIETLYKFAKTNEHTKIEINYVGQISEAYEKRLDEIKETDVINIYLQ